MSRIALFHQPRIPEAVRLSHEVADWLAARGHTVSVHSAWTPHDSMPYYTDVDLVVTFGGDGTVLRLGRLYAPGSAPVLSVNFGKLGFITELEPKDTYRGLEAFFAGQYTVERRLMLAARVTPAPERATESCHSGYGKEFYALNDIVVSRGGAARVIRLRVQVDNAPYTTFIADGAIVSTPTGSTAYSLAAGGPILDPSLETIVLTPIAPHLGMRQSLVLPAAYALRFELRTDHGAVLSADGQYDVPLDDADVIDVRRADMCASFVRLRPHTAFYQTLGERITRRILGGRD
ncbi:MAG: NAD(+)/NADH kinase [Dehalococcoidia bacterium]|nr:NAD(+)/NADH kinase [Dehalococcoidia bacterium]